MTALEPRPVIVSAMAEARPDLLSQITGFLRKRAFQGTQITLGATEHDHVTRLTFATPDLQEAARLVRELRRVLYVLEVHDLSQKAVVSRDLLLVKVSAGPTDRASIAQVCEVFRARIVNVAQSSVIVEATGSDEKLDGLLSVLVPYGIEEMTRTGPVVLGRSDDAAGKDLASSSWRNRVMQASPPH